MYLVVGVPERMRTVSDTLLVTISGWDVHMCTCLHIQRMWCGCILLLVFMVVTTWYKGPSAWVESSGDHLEASGPSETLWRPLEWAVV